MGYATHQRETINALKELGHRVINVNMGDLRLKGAGTSEGVPQESGGVKGVIKRLIPRFIWISLKDYKLRLHDKAAYKILEEAVQKHNPDFIYERNEILQDSGAKLAKKYKIPLILEVNAPFPEEMIRLEGKSFFSLVFSPQWKRENMLRPG